MPAIICFLIDDDQDDQEIFHMAAADAHKDIALYTASNCVEALEKFHREPGFTPDYIFIDINMPKLNGVDCLKAIKKVERLADIPVYMYSTYADSAMINECMTLGAKDFIVKPTNISELTAIMGKIFNKSTNNSQV